MVELLFYGMVELSIKITFIRLTIFFYIFNKKEEFIALGTLN